MLRSIYPYINENIERALSLIRELEEMAEEVVVAGGAAVGLLITDPANPTVRPTQDMDVIVQVINRADYYSFQERLQAKGFQETMDSEFVGRFVKGRMLLDVMPTDKSIFGSSNRWYVDAFNNAPNLVIDDVKFKLISGPYFLGTKIEAFYSRGSGDFLTSHDIEDCILLIDGRPEIVEEIRNADVEIKKYLVNTFSKLLEDDDFLESISGHLFTDEASQGRQPIIIDRLKEIASIDIP
jgi:hypothetical protein